MLIDKCDLLKCKNLYTAKKYGQLSEEGAHRAGKEILSRHTFVRGLISRIIKIKKQSIKKTNNSVKGWALALNRILKRTNSKSLKNPKTCSTS